jgi:adenosylhomocysteinase
MDLRASMNYDIKDIGFKEKGMLRIRWAENQMPVLGFIRERFRRDKPLEGIIIGACLHVTTETAALAITLKEGGASVFLCASNPLSTQDDVAAALVSEYEIPVFAKRGEDSQTYYSHIQSVIASNPHLTMDDGADLVTELHKSKKNIEKIIGGTEETTTGVVRLRSMAREGVLMYPIIAVNDASTKHFFDNRYGTGQSTLDGIIRATNLLIAGRTFVVCGYGWCGRGIAMRAKGFGANVVICEVNPLYALEAVMDGYNVMKISEAAKVGDIFITATGDINVLRREHFALMKDGVILANSGHFNVEISLPDLDSLAISKKEIRENVEEYKLQNGKRLYLLGEGRLVNLACAEGHPASVMDMSFANQALCVEHLVRHAKELSPQVYGVPKDIDEQVARLKLASMGITIDKLTAEQAKYITSWEEGT